MRVYLTPTARESIRDISAYISQFSPAAARRTRERLHRRMRQLAEHPFSGRIVPEFDVRSVREVIEGPYRIWYLVRKDRVEVLAVLHGARQLGDS